MTLECDYCHNLWRENAMKFYNLNDNKVLCEHCAEELFDSVLSDDYINYKGE